MTKLRKIISKFGFLIFLLALIAAAIIAMPLLSAEKDKSLKEIFYKEEKYCYDLETLKAAENPIDFKNVTLCGEAPLGAFSGVEIFIENDTDKTLISQNNENFLVDLKNGATSLKIYCMSSVDDADFVKEVSKIKIESKDGKIQILFREVSDLNFGALDKNDVLRDLKLQYLIKMN